MPEEEIFYEGKIDPDYKKKMKVKAVLKYLISVLPFSLIFIILFTTLSLSVWYFNKSSSANFFMLVIVIAVISVAILFLVLIVVGVYSEAYIKRFSFLIQKNDIVIYHGVFRRTRATIPYCRIQNIKVDSSILDRKYKLSSIYIETAGFSGLRTPYRGAYKIGQSEGNIPGQKDPVFIENALKEKIKLCIRPRDGLQ